MAELPVNAPTPPLVLTLELEREAQAEFERQRRRWFPKTLNRVPAHVSLFHALPGEQLTAIRALLADEAAHLGGFQVAVVDVMKLGRGVAYAMHAPELAGLHARLRAAWLPWLTRQDQQGFRPHLVVQNKAEPEVARALYDELAQGFRPWTVGAAALLLWWYRGGPWELAARFPLDEKIADGATVD